MATYCVIIPVLNEIENIENLTQSLLNAFKKTDATFLIIYIDDESTDGTTAFIKNKIAEGYPIRLLQRKKQGKGCKRGSALHHGVKWGLENTDAQFFIEMDGDLSHDPNEITAGIKALNLDYDVVIASKYLQESKIVGRSWYRNLISRVNSVLLRSMISRKIKDYSNGYRFYNLKAAKISMKHPVKQDGPLYLAEVLSFWINHQMNITEIPSIYYNRKKGATKVIIGDVWEGFIGAFSVAYRHHSTSNVIGE